MQLANRTFIKPNGDWIKVMMTHGDLVAYNTSKAIQHPNGSKQCSRERFKSMLSAGGYTAAK